MADRDDPDASPDGDRDDQQDAGAGSPDSSASKEPEEVGYKKPPRHTRFKPGQSGNPAGRPRRKLTAAEEFRKVAKMPVFITENGKRRKESTDRAIYLGIRRDALNGDHRARRDWLDLMRLHGVEATTDDIADLLAEDERLIAELRKSNKRNPGDDDGGDDGGDADDAG